jgi:flagellar biosynthetic protein FliR
VYKIKARPLDIPRVPPLQSPLNINQTEKKNLVGRGTIIEAEILSEVLGAAPAFLLVAARALAVIETAPLLSQDSVPQVAKIALAGLLSYAVFPVTQAPDWEPLLVQGDPGGVMFGLHFALLLIGEAVIGIITGFFMNLVFAAFSTAGQFFSLQMGFGAAETFDPISQQENPLMGQYLSLIAMLTFIAIGGLNQLFLGGFQRSIEALSVLALIQGREHIVTMLLGGLSRLFVNAFLLSLPILGTLFLTSLTTGLISKAAPTINILSEGFPISITVAFVLIYATLPFMIEAFAAVINAGFAVLQNWFIATGRPI